MKGFIKYTRCSTEEQSQDGFSHQYQNSILTNHQRTSDMICYGLYSDTVSGSSDIRIELQKALTRCKQLNKGKQKVHFLFVQAWDRFSRDIEVAWRFIKAFRDVGVEVNCPDDFIDYESEGDFLKLIFSLGFAQVQRMNIRKKTKLGLQQRLKEGHFITCQPYGYVNDKKKVAQIDPLKGMVVQYLFNEYSTGLYNVVALAKEVRRRFKVPMGKTTVHRILNDRQYLGLVHYKKENKYFAGRHQPLVCEQQFEMVQDILHGRNNKPINRNINHLLPLRGIITAPDLTTILTGSISKGKTKKVAYYHEQNNKKNSFRVNAKHAHKVIELVLNELTIDESQKELQQKIINEEMAAFTSECERRIKKTQAEIVKMDERMKNIKKDYFDRHITAQQFNDFNAQLMHQKTSLVNTVASIEAGLTRITDFKSRILELFSKLGEMFSKLSVEAKRKMLKAIFPDGFHIEKKSEMCRTLRINTFLTEILSKSTDYQYLVIEQNTEHPELYRSQSVRRTLDRVLIEQLIGIAA